LGCSRNTVERVLAAAADKGVTAGSVTDLDSGAVRDLLLGERPARVGVHTGPDFEWVHRQLARPGVTLQLLWGEYAEKVRAEGGVAYRYSSFTESYRGWAKVTGATMRIERKPGEVIEVDWAGDTMTFLDPGTGAARKAFLFVAALPYSTYFYVEAFADQRLSVWIDAHIAAFEFFGGVARLLVPDNLRTGVTRADRYEPVINPAYAQLAEHYGTAIIPARVRRPRDKAVVENTVRHGANAIIAALRDRQFIGLGEVNDAIAEQVGVINARPFAKRAGSRAEVFTTEEAPFLIPLPAIRFEMAEVRKAKVGPNYHVQVHGCYYSVPARWIGTSLDVRVTSTVVEVFNGVEKVASHARSAVKGTYRTNPDHMPPAHRAQLKDWTPARFTTWASGIGANTLAVVEAILASKTIVEQSYRSVLGVMALAKKPGGITHLEETCATALHVTTAPSYTLVKRLWAEWTPAAPAPKSLGGGGFVRGADYYKQQGGAQ
jgi:transposase